MIGLAAALAACGGGGDEPTEPSATDAPTTSVVSAEAPDGQAVGPDGGNIASPDGLLHLDIPPGALPVETAISISVMADHGLDPAFISGQVYELQPEGLLFEAPVTVTRTLSSNDAGAGEDEIPFVFAFHGAINDLEALTTHTTRDGDSLVVEYEISHFSVDFVVSSVQVLGDEVRFVMWPAAFQTFVGNSEKTYWNFGGTGTVETQEYLDGVAPTSAGAVASHVLDGATNALATCGPTEGTGTYSLSVSSKAWEATGVSLFMEQMLGSPEGEPWSTTATGNATCTDLDTSILDLVLGPADGSVSFRPSPGTSGPEFTADFTMETQFTDSEHLIERLQKPAQLTRGKADPVSGSYVTTSTTPSYLEVYFGTICPLADGTYWDYGFSLGLDPSLEAQLTEFFSSIDGTKIEYGSDSDPTELVLQPGWSINVPSGGCEGLDEASAFERAEAIRDQADLSVFGLTPQWDFVFAGTFGS